MIREMITIVNCAVCSLYEYTLLVHTKASIEILQEFDVKFPMTVFGNPEDWSVQEGGDE